MSNIDLVGRNSQDAEIDYTRFTMRRGVFERSPFDANTKERQGLGVSAKIVGFLNRQDRMECIRSISNCDESGVAAESSYDASTAAAFAMIRAQDLVPGSDDTHLARPSVTVHRLGHWLICLFLRHKRLHLGRLLFAAGHQIWLLPIS